MRTFKDGDSLLTSRIPTGAASLIYCCRSRVSAPSLVAPDSDTNAQMFSSFSFFLFLFTRSGSQSRGSVENLDRVSLFIENLHFMACVTPPSSSYPPPSPLFPSLSSTPYPPSPSSCHPLPISLFNSPPPISLFNSPLSPSSFPILLHSPSPTPSPYSPHHSFPSSSLLSFSSPSFLFLSPLSSSLPPFSPLPFPLSPLIIPPPSFISLSFFFSIPFRQSFFCLFPSYFPSSFFPSLFSLLPLPSSLFTSFLPLSSSLYSSSPPPSYLFLPSSLSFLPLLPPFSSSPHSPSPPLSFLSSLSFLLPPTLSLLPSLPSYLSPLFPLFHLSPFFPLFHLSPSYISLSSFFLLLYSPLSLCVHHRQRGKQNDQQTREREREPPPPPIHPQPPHTPSSPLPTSPHLPPHLPIPLKHGGNAAKKHHNDTQI
ncbi:hypothetical protein C7M84_021144 [Penaeus vannamei]|uniref:Uncharacterized protein n=1 Tax=Penaeus vannamei TaxID=6689 RepID=A0A3R7LPQ9_PENVA|nr:hypothetical protein C7M84_021144 [Penaeus vannamei]